MKAGATEGIIVATEYRIQAAVGRNSEDFKEEVHTTTVEALKSNNVSKMSEACGKLKARPKKRTKRLKDAEGNAAFNDREERGIIKQRFAGPVEGRDGAFARIIQKERQRHGHDKAEESKVALDIRAVPTLAQTTRMLATHNRQTAIGADRLG